MPDYPHLVERIKRELTIGSLLPRDLAGRRTIKCPLPGHDDRSPSFSVYAETNSWTCWSHPGGICGGSVLDFLMADRNVDFKEAVKIGAEMLGLELAPPTEAQREEFERWRRREDVLTILARVTHGWLMGDSDAARGARDTLAGRGFDEAFLREQRLGLLDIEKLHQIRAKHPVLADVTAQGFDDLGLRAEKDGRVRPLFRGARIAIPLLRRQRVTGFTFRALDPEQRAKYIHLPGAAGLYNEDALARKTVCLTEGVPDCWTLMALGIPACGNLGVHAVKHAEKFKHVQTLTLVWDNDEAGRKNVLKSARAIQEQMLDGEVRILHLEDVNDVNDFACAGGTAEEFQRLLDAAPGLIDYQIALLPDAGAGQPLRREDRPLLEGLLLSIAALGETEQVPWLKKLKTRLDSSLPSLRKDLQATAQAAADARQKEGQRKQAERPTDEAGTAEVETPLRFQFRAVRPVVAALDYNLEGETPRAHIGAWLRVGGADEAPGESAQCLIECEIDQGVPRARIVMYANRQIDDPKLARFPDHDLPRWSVDDGHEHSIPRFVKDPAAHTPNTAELFFEVRKLIEDYVWYPDEHEYDIVAVWILMTYLFPVFGAVGFLHFHGMKSAGKSLSLGFVDKLAFNPRKMDSATEAVLFRVVHNNRATLLLDEAEKFKHARPGSPEHNQRLLLNGSYKEDAQAMRMNMEQGQVESFSTYGPKCFGSINEIDHVLGDRCIVIRCLKIREEDKGKCLDHAQTGTLLKARACRLQNRLHCWALTHFHLAHQAYTGELVTAAPHLMAREREIWMPLLTVAHLIDRESNLDETRSVFDRLIATQKVKLREKQEKEQRENIDIIVLEALHNLLTGDAQKGLELLNHPHEYQTAKLAGEIHEQLVEEGTWPFDRKLTANRLTTLLKSTNIVQEEHLRRRHEGGKRISTARILAPDVRQALVRLQGFDDEAIELTEAAPPTPAPAPSMAHAELDDPPF